MLHFLTTSTRTCIMTCFQDIQLPGFSTSSTSVPLIGTPRNRVRSRQQRLVLRRMPQGLLRNKSSTCVALSATWSAETTRPSLIVVHCPMPSFTRGTRCYPTITFVKPLQVGWLSSSISLVKSTQLTSLASIGDTSKSGSNSNLSCSGRVIRGSHSKRSTARKSTTASLNGETLPTKVVAIKPILGSVKYEARSHYHSVLEEIVYIQELVFMSEIKMDKCSSSRKWGVTRFQQVWLNVNV